MYGTLHKALSAWLRSLPEGEQLMGMVQAEADIKGNATDFFRFYSDRETSQFLHLISKVTGCTVEECKYEAGRFFLRGLFESGYADALRTIGDDFFTMLQNMDSLHESFLPSFPKMRAPSIRPVRNQDGSLTVHYYSSNAGLAQFMMGALDACATQLFDLNIVMQHREKKSEGHTHDVFHIYMDERGYGVPRTIREEAKKQATVSLPVELTNELFPWHIAFDRNMRITSVGQNLAARLKTSGIGRKAKEVLKVVRPAGAKLSFDSLLENTRAPFLLSIDAQHLQSPFGEDTGEGEAVAQNHASLSRNVSHLSNPTISVPPQHPAQGKMSKSSSVASIGSNARSSLGGGGGGGLSRTATTGRNLAAPMSPIGECPFSSFASATGSLAPSANASAMSSKRNSQDMMLRIARLTTSVDNIKLHGQVTFCKDTDTMLFTGVPALHSQEQMEAQGISLSELPLHSHGREYLYGSMFQSASAKNTNEVDKRMAELDTSMAEVQEKKEQIDALLHSILPPVVANSLARGEIPPAEQYKHVTVLFSDIAGFTNISSEVPATEIMEMLHDLFVKFDALADKHGCYKVETIGDAYMVAAGCPEECSDHAERIARLAIDMVRTAETVRSPLDGEPIRIRVGIHSGPLMAGVVGRARPRYCLFGDTVNVASRMESNGLPGCIQTTYRFTQALREGHPFEIVPRGHIDIKGKGRMKTFLLLGVDDDSSGHTLLPSVATMEDLGPHLLEQCTREDSVADRLARIKSSATARRRRAVASDFV